VTTTLRARWWSRSYIGDVLLAQDRVLAAARSALAGANIGLSAPAGQVVNQVPVKSEAPLPALAKDQDRADPERPT
jgi:hypothetical protein